MKKLLLLLIAVFFVSVSADAQRKKGKAEADKKKDILSASTFSGMKFRSVGPAFASGRISDIAVHPTDESTWYVTVGSGGVWKTKNNGITWKPIFDKQKSYSTGCVAIDQKNPHVIWVGTGENVGGRHVGYGDGIYKSSDGGSTWKNMGLKDSEHISKIIIHPDNSNVVWVAVQGPLWSKGGERGLFKTIDGGTTWKQVLGDKEWVGVTDVLIDSRNPDYLYAATWQRHRTVAAYMGGGPGTGLHRSVDGGETWEKLKTGLPSSNMGKIGMAISPQQPDVIYAAIELDTRKGAVYKSTNRGSSWSKMSPTVSGGTGPHYYQELYACPHNFDRIYLMDVRVQVSDDGGKTFRRIKHAAAHSDNHAMAFRADDPDYLLIGSDGGLYESFDLAENWRFINNMPLTQYYKVAVDDAKPFYNILGGTQDVNTHCGPSRTDNVHGIRNADWYITLWGDGHQPATEPGNPNIVYSEWQQGNLCRIDQATGEFVYIKPQPADGESFERYNWDAPILVSSHDPKRLYFASQRVWRSENRGDTWKNASEDLTRQDKRLELPIMGGQQSYDNPWDVYAMSDYSTITSLAESPKNENLLYAGTDDGIIQVTENGGDSWRKIDASSLPGVPSRAFINDIKADLHDENVVYVAMDNHKQGDFKPYLFKSVNRGKTWNKITEGIPDRHLVWRIVQDHVEPNLMFAATEFGIFFTIDGGGKWIKMKGGLPTISFRDLAIQRRENDLVGASFGRSFYVLDDYSPLREMTREKLKEEGALFAVRDALWYIPRPRVGFGGKGNQGAAYYVAKNPDFGATFTYHIGKKYETLASKRKAAEKKLKKDGQSIPFPGWEALDAEKLEVPTKVWLVVKDQSGKVVRKLAAKTGKGLHRQAWDLRGPDTRPVRLGDKFDPKSSGFMVAPGRYTVTLVRESKGEVVPLDEPVAFNVVKMRDGSLPSKSPQVTAAFWQELGNAYQQSSALRVTMENANKKLESFRTALMKTSSFSGDLEKELFDTRLALKQIESMLRGSQAKRQVGEKNDPNIGDRLGFARTGTARSTYGPTEAHKTSLSIAQKLISEANESLNIIVKNKIPALEMKLKQVGAPWIEGQEIGKD